MNDWPKNPAEAEALKAYLDRLCLSLKAIDAARREEIRREVSQHLEMLAQSNPGQGLEMALTQFGDPAKVGRRMARQARWDCVRVNWRGLNWKVRVVFISMLYFACMGAALTVEFCRQMQWGHHLMAWFIIGPFVPLLLGWLWGTRDVPTRRGYLFIGATALLLAMALPVPGQYAHADMDRVGMMDLSSLVRLTYVVLWLWIACAACGVARILFGSGEGETPPKQAA